MLGLAALAAWPAAVAASRYSKSVDLVQALIGAAAVGLLLAVAAILLSRHARRRIQRTIGRSGGAVKARIGRALGVLGVCVATTGALALGFFGLLQLFAR